MLINYQGQGVGFSTDPDQLNDWLNGQIDGYKGKGQVNPAACARYAQLNNVPLYYQGNVNQADDFVVDNYLCTNNPVMLQVTNPRSGKSHYVVATSQTNVSGTNTFLINDPGYNNTSLQGYGFAYTGIRKFSSTPSAPHALVITGHSPIELTITDPNGLQTGFNPTGGQEFQQIPASSYATESIGDDVDEDSETTAEVKALEVLTPIDGLYNVQVNGTGTGSYTIDFLGYDAVGNPSIVTLAGTTTQGAVANYAVTYSSAPGAQIQAVPAISVSTSPTSTSVPATDTQQVTATVMNDPGNLGVTWTASGSGCVGQACGTVSPTTTSSGVPTTYTAPAAVPTPPAVTLTATSVADSTKSSSTALTLVANYTLNAVGLTPPTVTAGQNATATINVVPLSGTSGGAISLTCAVQPVTTAVGCSLSPASLTLGSGTAQSTLTITTTKSTGSTSVAPLLGIPPKWRYLAMLSLLCLSIGISIMRRRPRLVFSPVCLLVLLSFMQASCGGGGQSAPKMYTITVTGTPAQSGAAASVTLEVN